MKSLIYAVAAATMFAAPIAAFAQSNAPVTRAQVRNELIQLEKAGFDPATNDFDYPANIQAAEARVHAQQTEVASADTSYGPDMSGTAHAGRPAARDATSSIFFGQ